MTLNFNFLNPTSAFAWFIGCALCSMLSANGQDVAPAQQKQTPLSRIVFLGDSITQGGKYLAGPVASYRYQLFKHYVDNGILFSPMGMTNGASKGISVLNLTPNYRGVAFINSSEAAASARTYQYSGHPKSKPNGTWNVDKFKPDPQTVSNVKNRGPVTLKLGLKNPYSKGNTYFDGEKEISYTGETYPSLYTNTKPDTLCILLGINDVVDAKGNYKAIAKWVKEIAEAYQRYNPQIAIHVFKLLPTGKNNPTSAKNNYPYLAYNAYLDSLNIPKNWSTKSSKVQLHDISQGFYAKDGSMCDTDTGAHPNAQGELIIAGNIAKALGLPQRTCGFSEIQKPTSSLIPVEFSPENIAKLNTEKPITFSKSPTFNAKNWKAKAKNSLAISETSANSEAYLSFDWTKLSQAKSPSFYVTFDAKMTNLDSKTNQLTFQFGNGNDQVGILTLSQNGIFWNKTNLLYGSTLDLYGKESISDLKKSDPMLGAFTKDFNKFQLIYRNEGEQKGFYLWLNGQLIGEKLEGSAESSILDASKNQISFGDLDKNAPCKAEIQNLQLKILK